MSPLNLLVLLNVDFFAWPLAVIAEIRSRGIEVNATFFVVNDSTVTDQLQRDYGIPAESVICQSRCEPEWVSSPDGRRSLDAWRERLGSDAVDAVGLADRELSRTRVDGGIFPVTPLARLARNETVRGIYIAALLKTLDEVLMRDRYDCVLSYPTQDSSSAAAAILAGHHGILFLALKAIGLGTKACYFDDMKTMRPVFRHAFHGFQTGTSSPEPAALAEAGRILQGMRTRPQQPDYMRVANATIHETPGLELTAALLFRTVTRRRPDNLRYPYPWARLVFEYKRWWRTRRTLRWSPFEGTDRLGNRPFFYFPLHYEPEASTMVSAPEHMNQIEVLKDLARALPSGFLLAVKEHVPMIGRRPKGYYARVKSIANTVLLDPRISSFQLIRQAQATVTITGSAGFEAALLGRPVVFLGPSPIQVLPGGFVGPIDRKHLDSVLEQAPHIEPAKEEDLLNFLAALVEASVDVSASDIWGGTNVITTERLRERHQTVVRTATLLLRSIGTAHAC